MNDFQRITQMGPHYIKKLWRLSKELSQKTAGTTAYYFFDAIWCYILYQCHPEWYFEYFWKLSKPLRKDTLTLNNFARLYKRYNDVSKIEIFENKVLFNQKFKNYQHHASLYTKEATLEQFTEFCQQYPTFIAKPTNAQQGSGVHKVEITKDTDIKSLYEDLKKNEVLTEEIVRCHPKLIFKNKSLNTIRVYSIVGKSGEVVILTAILRAGVGDSVVDNYCAGGVIYNIDVEHGIVTEPGHSEHGGNKVVMHPQSDLSVIGLQIPRWNQLIDYVKTLATVVPECRIIGWDIAVTETGLDVIEGNHDPHWGLLEIFSEGGMLSKIKRILQ